MSIGDRPVSGTGTYGPLSPFYGATGNSLTTGWTCKKRDGSVVPFDADKVSRAVAGCLRDVNHPPESAPAIVTAATAGVVARLAGAHMTCPEVEHVQRLVIQWLWSSGMFDAAEAYQNYREHHRKKRELETAAVFDRRTAFKPFDYPEVIKFKEAVQHSFWLVSELGFESDVQDYRVNLSPVEQSAVRRAALAISQIEVAVKDFWAKLGDRLPRAEFKQVGAVFADSEVRHADAYSRILEVLGFNDEFLTVTEVPAIRARIDYLGRNLRAVDGSDREFIRVLTAFTVFVENVSLFSQFLILKSFWKHRAVLKEINTAVQATQVEEQIHAMFGAYVVNLVREQRGEWFGPAYFLELGRSCDAALAAETDIVDWIFGDGELTYLTRHDVIEFIKDRINQSLRAVGGADRYKTDPESLERTKWFYEGLVGHVDVDFFHMRSTNYSSRSKPVTASEIF